MMGNSISAFHTGLRLFHIVSVRKVTAPVTVCETHVCHSLSRTSPHTRHAPGLALCLIVAPDSPYGSERKTRQYASVDRRISILGKFLAATTVTRRRPRSNDFFSCVFSECPRGSSSALIRRTCTGMGEIAHI
jgi:hypothetical protein